MPMPYSYPYQPAQPSVNGLIKVHGIEGAWSYPLPPNSQLILLDEDEDIFYVKMTDIAGNASVSDFRFEPIVHDEPKREQGDYLSRSEFEEWADKICSMIQGADKVVPDGE